MTKNVIGSLVFGSTLRASILMPESGAFHARASNDFAGLLRDALGAVSTRKDAMMQRIAEVGLAQYTQEQRQIQRMARIMDLIRAESPRDIQKELNEILDDLRRNPPLTPEEMYDRIGAHIGSIRDDAPDDLKRRMEYVFGRIDEMMAMPDVALDRLEDLQRSRTATLSMPDSEGRLLRR